MSESKHTCATCGIDFTIRPAIPDGTPGYENCLGPDCESYDPHRDLDVLFMSDEEIKKLPIVSMDKLRQRQKGVKLDDGTYAVDLYGL